jgi:hypothetical protein
MGLPKIDLPIYELTLPSTGEILKYRPFTVKEEKVLLVAQEADDPMQELLAAKQVVNNCVIDKDISSLAMFDLEFIILNLRAKSVDNETKFGLKDPDTLETVELVMDLNTVSLQTSEEHSNKIKINEEFSLFLKYPTIDEYIKIRDRDPEDPLLNYFILTACLDKVASEDEVHEFRNYSAKEVDDFMENVSSDIVKGIQKFFETMPRLRHTLYYTNKDGTEKTFAVEGMNSFFI